MNFVGYTATEIDGMPVAVFYPTTELSKKKVRWIPNNNKFWRNALEAQEVITQKKQKMPFWMYKFVSSYMSTYYLSVNPDTPLKQQ